VSGHLNPGGQQFRGDRGTADPRVTAALAAYQVGQGSELAALAALAAARLLVPVIAVPGSGSDPAARSKTGKTGKGSEMVLPTLIGRDGRAALIAFTGLDTLARWRPDARPVPAEAIDVAGPVPLAVQGARLAALAAGQPVPPPHDDPDVRAEVQAAVAGEPAIAGFGLAPGRAENTDLAITLQLAKTAPATTPATAAAVNRATAALAARLGARLRRGIEVVIAE
jgi:hypothetical protein